MENKKVKTVLFRCTINGRGIVNYDSNEQRFIFYNTNLQNTMYDSNKNVKFSQKHFNFKDGKLSYRVAITSDTLRHGIFIKETQMQSPSVLNNNDLFYSFIASPTQLLRGYFFGQKENDSFKRSSAISIVDAVQNCDAVSHLAFHSSSAVKNSDKENLTSDQTIFKKESIGDTVYETFGSFDIMKAQFVSTSQLFDRYAFNPDYFEKYKNYLSLKMPNFNSELGYFIQKDSDVMVPEHGFLLSGENVLFMLKFFLERLKSFYIARSTAYVAIDKLQYKLVYDPIVDTMFSESGWLTINSREDINNISFEPEMYYSVTDTEAANSLIKEIDETYKAKRDKKNQEIIDTKNKKAAIKKEKEDKTNQ